ncbi:uncharacterized protein LOC131145663 isoform X2 [Malania oleifera]|uniref:uncharacterized protein LOC131145663 isoform X2 n=1 Tax=Malania oleifera TaxID=397392 RepID=UPI0025AE8B1B|nr:uncharacterized protein LOC131145663 isoform X2 [Malania oleifera]
MDDAEKLTALKRAYADIILNTAKEAAARIMASERKAFRLQQELCATKDESLRMLLRLKQMMDFKVKEAEVTSSSQQKKIEELEAQLQEAEDIVKDLREELTEVQGELENVRSNQIRHLEEQDLNGDPATQEEQLQENRLDSFGSFAFPPDPHSQVIATSDVKSSSLDQRFDGNKCHSANDSIMEVCYIGKPDFASLIMRSKEPELYRNGCTQRIRALEGSLLDGKCSLHGHADEANNETIVREDEENEHTCIKPAAKADNMCLLPAGFEDVMQENNGCNNSQAVKPTRRKKRRAARYRRAKKYLPDKIMETHQTSDHSCSQNDLYSLKNNVQAGEAPFMITDDVAQKHLESPSPPTLPSGSMEMGMQSGCVQVNESAAAVLKACSVQNASSQDKGLVENSMLIREESGSAQSSAVPVELEKVDFPLISSDLKASDTADDVPSQPGNGKFLKYTFTRKRKKEALSSSVVNASFMESALKKKAGEKQNGSLEPQKSSLTIESSRDSRRLAQVARQLISLSEKRW